MKKNLLLSLFLLVSLFIVSCSDGGGTALSPYDYHTPEEVETFLDEILLNYESITSSETVGYSTDGKTIRAIIISDNPRTLEGEPAIRLTAGIHGSEMISVELLIRFIEYLTSNYSTDPSVRDIVNSSYIVIIPVLNPDGLAAKTRYNSNGVDLNRNFGYAWSTGSSHGSAAFSEMESRAMKTFSESNIFHLSVTYHSGSVLVNMPFDYGRESTVAPVENNLVKAYAKAYTGAGTFLTNPDLSKYTGIDDGIINGGNWYIATGSLQDWSYMNTGCLDLTIEVANRNPDTESGVEQVFMYNRDSLMAYIRKGGYGVRGRVTAPDGAAVAGAKVTVTYNSGGTAAEGDIYTYTDSKGYYNRILLGGSYTLKFTRDGFAAYEQSVDIPDNTSSITRNITLTP